MFSQPIRTSKLQVGKALNWNGDPAGKQREQMDSPTNKLTTEHKYSDEQECLLSTSGSPALLSLQQLPVGGDLDIQGQLDVEEVLVLLQVSRHLLLQCLDLLLKMVHRILVTSGLHGEAVLHLPKLAVQRLVLKGKRRRRKLAC